MPLCNKILEEEEEDDDDGTVIFILDKGDRRINHNLSEKKRKDKLKLAIQEIKSCLPLATVLNRKLTLHEILQKACEHIKMLTKENEEMLLGQKQNVQEAVIEKLRAENAHLLQENARLLKREMEKCSKQPEASTDVPKPSTDPKTASVKSTSLRLTHKAFRELVSNLDKQLSTSSPTVKKNSKRGGTINQKLAELSQLRSTTSEPDISRDNVVIQTGVGDANSRELCGNILPSQLLMAGGAAPGPVTLHLSNTVNGSMPLVIVMPPNQPFQQIIDSIPIPSEDSLQMKNSAFIEHDLDRVTASSAATDIDTVMSLCEDSETSKAVLAASDNKLHQAKLSAEEDGEAKSCVADIIRSVIAPVSSTDGVCATTDSDEQQPPENSENLLNYSSSLANIQLPDAVAGDVILTNNVKVSNIASELNVATVTEYQHAVTSGSLLPTDANCQNNGYKGDYNSEHTDSRFGDASGSKGTFDIDDNCSDMSCSKSQNQHFSSLCDVVDETNHSNASVPRDTRYAQVNLSPDFAIERVEASENNTVFLSVNGVLQPFASSVTKPCNNFNMPQTVVCEHSSDASVIDLAAAGTLLFYGGQLFLIPPAAQMATSTYLGNSIQLQNSPLPVQLAESKVFHAQNNLPLLSYACNQLPLASAGLQSLLNVCNVLQPANLPIAMSYKIPQAGFDQLVGSNSIIIDNTGTALARISPHLKENSVSVSASSSDSLRSSNGEYSYIFAASSGAASDVAQLLPDTATPDLGGTNEFVAQLKMNDRPDTADGSTSTDAEAGIAKAVNGLEFQSKLGVEEVTMSAGDIEAVKVTGTSHVSSYSDTRRQNLLPTCDFHKNATEPSAVLENVVKESNSLSAISEKNGLSAGSETCDIRCNVEPDITSPSEIDKHFVNESSLHASELHNSVQIMVPIASIACDPQRTSCDASIAAITVNMLTTTRADVPPILSTMTTIMVPHFRDSSTTSTSIMIKSQVAASSADINANPLYSKEHIRPADVMLRDNSPVKSSIDDSDFYVLQPDKLILSRPSIFAMHDVLATTTKSSPAVGFSTRKSADITLVTTSNIFSYPVMSSKSFNSVQSGEMTNSLYCARLPPTSKSSFSLSQQSVISAPLSVSVEVPCSLICNTYDASNTKPLFSNSHFGGFSLSHILPPLRTMPSVPHAAIDVPSSNMCSTSIAGSSLGSNQYLQTCMLPTRPTNFSDLHNAELGSNAKDDTIQRHSYISSNNRKRESSCMNDQTASDDLSTSEFLPMTFDDLELPFPRYERMLRESSSSYNNDSFIPPVKKSRSSKHNHKLMDDQLNATSASLKASLHSNSDIVSKPHCFLQDRDNAGRIDVWSAASSTWPNVESGTFKVPAEPLLVLDQSELRNIGGKNTTTSSMQNTDNSFTSSYAEKFVNIIASEKQTIASSSHAIWTNASSTHGTSSIFSLAQHATPYKQGSSFLLEATNVHPGASFREDNLNMRMMQNTEHHSGSWASSSFYDRRQASATNFTKQVAGRYSTTDDAFGFGSTNKDSNYWMAGNVMPDYSLQFCGDTVYTPSDSYNASDRVLTNQFLCNQNDPLSWPTHHAPQYLHDSGKVGNSTMQSNIAAPTFKSTNSNSCVSFRPQAEAEESNSHVGSGLSSKPVESNFVPYQGAKSTSSHVESKPPKETWLEHGKGPTGTREMTCITQSFPAQACQQANLDLPNWRFSGSDGAHGTKIKNFNVASSNLMPDSFSCPENDNFAADMFSFSHSFPSSCDNVSVRSVYSDSVSTFSRQPVATAAGSAGSSNTFSFSLAGIVPKMSQTSGPSVGNRHQLSSLSNTSLLAPTVSYKDADIGHHSKPSHPLSTTHKQGEITPSSNRCSSSMVTNNNQIERTSFSARFMPSGLSSTDNGDNANYFTVSLSDSYRKDTSNDLLPLPYRSWSRGNVHAGTAAIATADMEKDSTISVATLSDPPGNLYLAQNLYNTHRHSTSSFSTSLTSPPLHHPPLSEQQGHVSRLKFEPSFPPITPLQFPSMLNFVAPAPISQTSPLVSSTFPLQQSGLSLLSSHQSACVPTTSFLCESSSVVARENTSRSKSSRDQQPCRQSSTEIQSSKTATKRSSSSSKYVSKKKDQCPVDWSSFEPQTAAVPSYFRNFCPSDKTTTTMVPASSDVPTYFSPHTFASHNDPAMKSHQGVNPLTHHGIPSDDGRISSGGFHHPLFAPGTTQAQVHNSRIALNFNPPPLNAATHHVMSQSGGEGATGGNAVLPHIHNFSFGNFLSDLSNPVGSATNDSAISISPVKFPSIAPHAATLLCDAQPMVLEQPSHQGYVMPKSSFLDCRQHMPDKMATTQQQRPLNSLHNLSINNILGHNQNARCGPRSLGAVATEVVTAETKRL